MAVSPERADDAVQSLGQEAVLRLRSSDTAPPWPDAVASVEYARSPATSRIARHARDAGLFHFHFERRVHVPLPVSWVPADSPELADPPEWQNGILPERKYQSFRHDLPIASYHPHHRAKWAGHELCHGLVGFAWHPRATPFFHATASRLAELLPVALWYFYDEAFLTRCPQHQGGGALFRHFCRDCETAARTTTEDPRAARTITEGLRFVDSELAAIARGRRLGKLIPHRFATIDLCTDGIQYAAAHGARLASPAMHEFAERFLVAGGGYAEHLDALEARVIAMQEAILYDTPPTPLAPTSAHGRARWVLQDIGWRLILARQDADGESASSLRDIVASLGDVVSATTNPALSAETITEQCDSALRAAREGYAELAEAGNFPHPDDLFAVGYHATATSSGWEQLSDGLASCVPLTRLALEDVFDSVVQRFASTDTLHRIPLATRFANFLGNEIPGPIHDLCRWEAALAAVPPTPPPLAHHCGEGWRLAEHMQVLLFDHDVIQMAERLDTGSLECGITAGQPTLTPTDGVPVTAAPTAIVLGRDDQGELLLLDLDPEAASSLRGPTPEEGLLPEELESLVELGVLVPARLHELGPED